MHSAPDKNASKLPSIPGFTALSDQVLVRDPGNDVTPDENENDNDNDNDNDNGPRAILIYGWGDGLPKHVAKYTEGYARLFPRAKQVVVLGPIGKAMFSDLPKRSADMAPVVDCIGDLLEGEEGERTGESGEGGENRDQKLSAPILVHAMSNTGAVNYSSTLAAHRDSRSAPLPHRLLVLDSTPGNPNPTPDTMLRWSRAMTIGTASWFPWPFAVTQALWGVVLCFNIAWGWLLGREPSGAFGVRAIDDQSYETKGAKRLYLYSREDDLISYRDIEGYAAASREKGYRLRMEMFEGSGHVAHMRASPERYWRAIRESWEWACEGGRS